MVGDGHGRSTRAALTGIALLAAGCSLAVRDAPITHELYYAGAARTPRAEHIEGTVMYVDTRQDGNDARMRAWIADEDRVYLVQCPRFCDRVHDLVGTVVSLPGTVVGEERGVRIYDGCALLR